MTRSQTPVQWSNRSWRVEIVGSNHHVREHGGDRCVFGDQHAVRGLTEALSIELKRYGVRAADLLPGLVDTLILSPQMKAMAPPDGMWRLVPPSEVAEIVWAAYSNRLHWYVPEELRAFHARVVADPSSFGKSAPLLPPK